MSKKYFCKYLPVEGEIKLTYQQFVKILFLFYNGELYEHYPMLNNLDISTHTFIMNVGEKTGKHVLVSECTVAKLFLVSRDIQVGDKLIKDGVEYLAHSRPDGVPFIGYYNKDWCYLDDDCFKVIGEISPDALPYVTEGQEFDEKDIEEWYFHLKQNCFAISVKFADEISNNPPNYTSNTWEERKDTFKRGVFKIKGQCGYFH